MEKRNKITRLFILLTVIAGLSVTGCKKKDDATPATDTTTTTSVPMGTLITHLHAYVGSEEVYQYGADIIYTSTGRKISLSMAQLYISTIQLVKMDGSLYTVPNTVLLQVPDIMPYLIGKVPAGNYKSIRFYVGLDSNTNKKVPSSSPDDVLNKPSMWFGSAAQPEGYAFVNIEGRIDTSENALGSDIEMKSFMYKIGTNSNYKQVIMPDKNFTVTPDQTQHIHMYSDFGRLLNGIDFSNKKNLMIMSVSENDSALAKTIAANIPHMFHYE